MAGARPLTCQQVRGMHTPCSSWGALRSLPSSTRCVEAILLGGPSVSVLGRGRRWSHYRQPRFGACTRGRRRAGLLRPVMAIDSGGCARPVALRPRWGCRRRKRLVCRWSGRRCRGWRHAHHEVRYEMCQRRWNCCCPSRRPRALHPHRTFFNIAAQ